VTTVVVTIIYEFVDYSTEVHRWSSSDSIRTELV